MTGPLTQEWLKQVLRYDPDTGEWHWLVTRRGGHPSKGSQAGYVRRDGYRIVEIEGVKYRSHRLAWFYMTGIWPPAIVDHRNATPGDDRWENLRKATRSQNGANRLTHHQLPKGVSIERRTGKFRARIKKNYREIALGTFLTPEQAAAAYASAAVALHGEFARTGR